MLESVSGVDCSYGVHSVVTLPFDVANSFVAAGVARIIDRDKIVVKKEMNKYPIAYKLNYGKEISNSV